MNLSWCLQTGRLQLTPVSWADLADLVALKGDPRAYAMMLGGVRTQTEVAEELAEEMADWPRLGFGMWSVRLLSTRRFVGIVGLQERPDGRGVGLRFSLLPSDQGLGYASEAAGAALRFGHDRAGLTRIVGVTREDNFASMTVLGAIGMQHRETFSRDGVVLLLSESTVQLVD